MNNISDLIQFLEVKLNSIAIHSSRNLQISFVNKRDELKELGDTLISNTSKFVVLNHNASNEDILPITTHIKRSFEEIFQLFKSLLSQAGPTMKKEILELANNLLRSFSHSVSQKQMRLNQVQLTGIFCDLCNNLYKIPLENRFAVNKLIIQQLKLMKDAIEELERIQVNDDNEDDIFDDTLTQEEYPVVPHLSCLIKTCFSLVQDCSKAILLHQDCEFFSNWEGYISSLETTLKLSCEISSNIDSIGSTLSSPIQKEELHTNVSKLLISIDSLCKLNKIINTTVNTKILDIIHALEI